MFSGMHTRLTAKLFHTVVVLGVGLTAGCSSSDTSEPNNPTPASTATGNQNTSGSTPEQQAVAANDAGTDAAKASTSSSSSSSSGDAFPGWLCCG